MINPVISPTIILEMEGYFHYANHNIYYRHNPFDLLDFNEDIDAIEIKLVSNDIFQYRLIIESQKYQNWEIILDKTAYWWFNNGVYISETPIRTDNGIVAPQIKLDFGFHNKKKYKLTWIQLP